MILTLKRSAVRVGTPSRFDLCVSEVLGVRKCDVCASEVLRVQICAYQ